MKTFLFEGSEKKMEVIFSPVREPLRNQPESFWKKICGKAQARIVSRFSNSFCDSYVLSESSLFIWDHRLLMLTCGRTPLIDSILSLVKSFKKSDIELLFYQRKNEFFPYNQRSSFMDDFEQINKKRKGRAYCFGQPDEHHFYLFYSRHQHYYPDNPDRTLEVLMYDADDWVKKIFIEASSVSEIRSAFQLDKIFKNTQVDDYIFQPAGYSLNGLSGENEYYTVHVTVQDPGFYISFETNIQDYSMEWILDRVLRMFRPVAFDVIVFSSGEQEVNKAKNYMPELFTRSSYFSRRLDGGYSCLFANFFKPFKEARPAFELKL